ncbi:MAG: hypothetical protein J6N72_09690 [Psychrobacter sp.]|nr:hypothetical protein [Psychrobacter sp.]
MQNNINSVSVSIIRNDLLNTLNEKGMVVDINTQESRPSVEWEFMGNADYMLGNNDKNIDTSKVKTAAKLRTVMNIDADDCCIVPIYENNGNFSGAKNTVDGKVVGFGVFYRPDDMPQSTFKGRIKNGLKREVIIDLRAWTFWAKGLICQIDIKKNGKDFVTINDVEYHPNVIDNTLRRATSGEA